MTRRQKLIIIWSMLYCRGWGHLENRQKDRLGEVELKARGWRTAWVRPCKPFGPAMIDGRPEFSRTIPDSGVLLIDTVLEKIVRVRFVRSVMQSDRLL